MLKEKSGYTAFQTVCVMHEDFNTMPCTGKQNGKNIYSKITIQSCLFEHMQIWNTDSEVYTLKIKQRRENLTKDVFIQFSLLFQVLKRVTLKIFR